MEGVGGVGMDNIGGERARMDVSQVLKNMDVKDMQALYNYISELLGQVEEARKKYSAEIEIVIRVAKECGEIKKKAEDEMAKLQEQIRAIERKANEEIKKRMETEEFKRAKEKLQGLHEEVLKKLVGEDAVSYITGEVVEKPKREVSAAGVRGEGLGSKVKQFLIQNRGRKFTSDELASIFGVKASEIGHAIYHMVARGSIMKEKVGGRAVYWVE